MIFIRLKVGGGVYGLATKELADGRRLYVLKELDDNPGKSVTNAIEVLASFLCKINKADPADLVFIEHYPRRGRGGQVAPTWDLVEFRLRKWAGDDWLFMHPEWRRMTPADWAELGMEPPAEEEADHGN